MKTITVYSGPLCNFCEAAKRLLQRNNLSFKEIDISKEAGLREMEEEIGTRNVQLVGEMGTWLNYDIPQKLSQRLWNGKYRGQTQKWLAYRFLGTNDEINIKTENPEFIEWKWEDHKKLPELAVPFKRNIYEKVINEFEKLFSKI